jgi:hypothetical protein
MFASEFGPTSFEFRVCLIDFDKGDESSLMDVKRAQLIMIIYAGRPVS